MATVDIDKPTAILQAEEAAPALPEGATGFRERKNKNPPRPSPTVPGMTVGSVRRALNQIRRAGTTIRPEHLLYNGMPAGKFALALVLGMYSRRKKPAAKAAEGEADGGAAESDGDDSQMTETSE